jgi:hypothetical protein
MAKFTKDSNNIVISLPFNSVSNLLDKIYKRSELIILFILIIVSIGAFFYYWQNGLGVAYNDARSHLDISRRVVEGIKPGFAQLGSVWLPLPHVLMTFTVWNDFMWHSGLSGALVSMISFVATGILIYKFLKQLEVGLIGRIIGVLVFACNLNILYLQSTAMTELLLIATMTAGAYELLLWHKTNNYLNLIKAAFFIMLSTLTRYDGWFLLFFSTILIFFHVIREKGYKATEGILILFLTLGAFGVVLWFGWNQLIFKDALYFALGPFSAKAQQDLLSSAGVLPTKHNLWLSAKVYFYALAYNSGTFTLILGVIGSLMLWFDNKIIKPVRIASWALMAPLFFNILALFFGHSVLYVQGISGNTWFNVRYGIMMLPTIAIFVGYLVNRLRPIRLTLISLLLFITVFSFLSNDAVTIDDARYGSSQKNVTEVSNWLKNNVADKNELILISAASHDAIIFSSGLPMKRFIHEGAGTYWENAISYPDRWVKWIVLRTYDKNDLTFKLLSEHNGLSHYQKVESFPYADIYELKPEYWQNLTNNMATIKAVKN